MQILLVMAFETVLKINNVDLYLSNVHNIADVIMIIASIEDQLEKKTNERSEYTAIFNPQIVMPL